MKKVICLIVFLLASSLFGQSVKPNEIQQLRTKIEQLEKTIKKQQETIETLKIEWDEQRKENTRLQALLRKNGIKTSEETITNRRDGGQSGFNVPLSDNPYAAAVDVPLAIGEVLWMGNYYKLYVESIIDDTNMIADLQSSYRKLAQVKSPGRKMPTLGPDGDYQTAIIKRVYHQSVWVKGLATNGLADGRYVEYKGELQITGTKKYGNSTMFLLEPVYSHRTPDRRVLRRQNR